MSTTMFFMTPKSTDNAITSLDLVKQINIFRKQDWELQPVATRRDCFVELQHKDILKIIRDEFSAKIDEGKISPISYIDSMNREKPMFLLTFSQGKQILMRESVFVRTATIDYIEKLEEAIREKNTPSYMIADPRKRAEKWIEEQEAIQKLEEQKKQLIEENVAIGTRLEIVEPKAEIIENIENTALMPMGTIGVLLTGSDGKKPSAKLLNVALEEDGIIESTRNAKNVKKYQLCEGFRNNNYVNYDTYTRSSDRLNSDIIDMRWTQTGKDFLFSWYEERGRELCEEIRNSIIED